MLIKGGSVCTYLRTPDIDPVRLARAPPDDVSMSSGRCCGELRELRQGTTEKLEK